MSIPQGHRDNLETLKRVFEDGAAAVMECRVRSTGEVVSVLCAAQLEDGMYTFTPFCQFFNGDPFDILEPPNPGGGFYS